MRLSTGLQSTDPFQDLDSHDIATATPDEQMLVSPMLRASGWAETECLETLGRAFVHVEIGYKRSGWDPLMCAQRSGTPRR